MSKRFRISIKGIRLESEFTDENPRTVEAVLKALPIKGHANLWGDEIYFSTPVNLKEEKARSEVEVGSVAYWPPGKAICIFFGPTPASRGTKPAAASPVNVFAKVLGDLSPLRNVHDGDEVVLEKLPG